MKTHRSNILRSLIIVLVCIVTFGLYIPQLGLYLDDWPVFAAAKLYGIDHLWDYYFIDTRPVSSWTYHLLLNVLGYQPIHWQIFTLSIRCLTAVAFWAVLREVWPKSTRLAFFAALLFAVSPIFKQQPTAVTFHQGWTQYLLLFISFWLMLRSVRTKSGSGRVIYIFFSLVAIALSDSISEYFVGVELVRAALLWVVVGPQKDWKQRAKITLLYWLPYLLLLGLFVFWRLFLMETPSFDRNKPGLLFNLVRHPRYVLLTFSRLAFQDLIYVLFLSWVGPIAALLQGPRPDPAIAPLWIALSISVALWIFLFFFDRDDQNENKRVEALTAIAIGIFVVLVAGIPGWAIGRQASATTGAYDDRFAFAGMFGAGIFLAGLIDLLPVKRYWKAVPLVLFVLISVQANLDNTLNYVQSWKSQRMLYWQLVWRAPDIESQTVLFSDREHARYMGSWATASAFNLLYPKVNRPDPVMYWYLNIHKMRDKLPEFLNGTELYYRHNTLAIDVPSTQVIGFLMPHDPNACLWIISPKDHDNPLLPHILRDTAMGSHPERIHIRPKDPKHYPPREIFGEEPPHNWCYIFEKASLAQQHRQWKEIPRLWETAQAQGDHPGNGLELIPFIEGYAQTDQWERALELSRQSHQLTPNISPYLCKIWSGLEKETAASDTRTNTVNQLRASMPCGLPPH